MVEMVLVYIFKLGKIYCYALPMLVTLVHISEYICVKVCDFITTTLKCTS